MTALANILGLPPFSIPFGIGDIHFMQLPIIFAALAMGAVAGGTVGLLGVITMAFITLPRANPFILPGNALLGFFVGLVYSKLKDVKPPFLPQLLALMVGVAVQFPYTYVTDVYLASLPSAFVLFPLLPLLFVEDIISLFISHVILFRTDISQILSK